MLQTQQTSVKATLRDWIGKFQILKSVKYYSWANKSPGEDWLAKKESFEIGLEA